MALNHVYSFLQLKTILDKTSRLNRKERNVIGSGDVKCGTLYIPKITEHPF